MRRRPRKWLIVLILLGLSCALVLGGYGATRHVPGFYQHAIEESAGVRQASHDMKRRVTALASDTLRPGRWQAVFSDEQINGYLAVDLADKHSRLLPSKVHDPRVALRRDGVLIGWQYEARWPAAVYSVTLVPYIVSPNVLAVRIRSIRAGAVPVPLGQVVDGLSEAALQFGLRLRWRQVDGDPVAIVELPPSEDDAANQLVLEAVELGEGRIALSGHTEPRRNGDSAAVTLPGARVADHPTENEKRQ